MISHKQRCIFIHIPKCAGTSIEAAFGHLSEHEGRGGQDHRPLRHIEQPVFQKAAFASKENIREVWRRFRGRLKPQKNHRNRYTVTEEQFYSYYKFSVVRNPWSRAFSWYKNVMKDPIHRKNLQIPDKQSFDEFLNIHAGKGYLMPQTYWLKNFRGEIALDYIGKFETLAGDFRKVCKDLGAGDIQLPHKLKSDSSDYRDYYNVELKNMIAGIYKEEIKLFDYTFET